MITNTMEFPCVEANRCYLTEKEHGMRLSLTEVKKRKEESEFTLNFSKSRGKKEEWYVHLDTTSTETGTRRVLTLRHCATGRYLYSNSDGQVGTQVSATELTTWLMEPVASVASAAPSSPTSHDTTNHLYFSLVSQAHAPRKLAYSNASFASGTALMLTASTWTTLGESATWELEFTSGELCFMSNPIVHCQIRCNVFGQLSLSRGKFQGWEVFRFIEVGHGNVAISSWTHSHKFLSSDPDGQVVTTENRLGAWEKWELVKADHGVHIRSVAHPGRYLSVGRIDNEALHTTTKPNGFSLWHLDAAHSHVYFLSTVTTTSSSSSSNSSTSTNSTRQQYISSNRRGPFVTKNRRKWEEWRMERSTNGDITFWSVAQNKYLGSNSKGDAHTTSSKGDWSRWEMEESPHHNGGIYLKSKAHQRLLSFDGQQLSTTEDQNTATETWWLEPRLPRSISGPKIAALGAAGALGLALTVVMPYAVLGVVEVAGLTATELGLAAGFTAEALVGFGGGALLGATVVGTTVTYVNDSKNNNADLSPTAEIKEDYLTGSLRPISAWRNW